MSASSHETDGFHVLYRAGHDLVRATTHRAVVVSLSPEDAAENTYAHLPVTQAIFGTSITHRS